MEQDPWQVLGSVVDAVSEAVHDLPENIDVGGFAHQGETVLAWDLDTLEPLAPAIVWSDRRPEAVTHRLSADGFAERVFELSGTPLDSYFCAAKYRWMLDELEHLRARAAKGTLQLGTLETWLLLQLDATHQTDIGTASRTQLTRLGGSTWEPELLDLFGLSASWLAPIGPSLTDRGALSHTDWHRGVPLRAVMVDQPAALVGSGCLREGDAKVTYGTGAFVLVNAGRAAPPPQDAVITSVGWGDDLGPVYILDGGVLSVGSALNWLAGLGVDVSPRAHARLAGRGPSPLVVLPAMSGTGAPRWDRGATASIAGITADTDGDDLLQAFLDSFAFRVREITQAMEGAGVPRPSALRVDGGLTRSAYLMQRQADVLDLPILVSAEDEATALGIAAVAGTSIGTIDLGVLERPPSTVYQPRDPATADSAYHRWLSVAYNRG